MIFVIVGTHYQGFERLIKKMDEIAARIDNEVIMQIGHTRYEPKNAKYFTFIEKEEDFIDLYKKSDIIISHAGAGTLLTALILHKKIIIVPRLKKFKEHIDNQQLELANILAKNMKLCVVYDISELENVLKTIEISPTLIENKSLICFLIEYLGEIAK